MKTEYKTLEALVAAALGALASYALQLTIPLAVLLIVMVLDYITGIVKAWMREELSSRVGIFGIIKKLGYLVIVAVAGVVDWLLAYGLQQVGIDLRLPFLLAAIVTCWLIINELISILENIAAQGGPVPPWLGRLLNRLKNTVDETVEPPKPDRAEDVLAALKGEDHDGI